MTIETVVSKTIQSGNGSNKDFDFAFEIPDEDSLSLTKRASDGTETAITTNFTVTGIGDESGGSVNYPTSGSALTSQEKIIIKRVISLKQLENLRNQGDYSLEDIEDALDRAVMLCQQLQEQIDRSLKLPLTSSSTYVTVDDFVANKLLYVSSDGTKVKMSDADFGSIQTYLTALAAIAADISAVAAIDTEVTTVAGISANVTTVAGIDTEVTTVAGIAAAVSAVAAIDSDVTQVSSIHAAVSTVSGIAAAVSTVAGISAAVSTVSGIAAAVSGVNTIAAAVSGVYAIDDDVVAVAAIAADITSVAGNAANINTVAGIAADVTAVAAISANVTTVAGISANVTTVAGMSSNIASVVANLASIQNAASFGFPTLSSGDKGKLLRVKDTYDGYEAFAFVGAVIPFAINSAPSGWLECNGAAISRTTYATLFAAIGTTFGSGNGSTTFNIPDLRGEFVRGWDNGKGTDSGRTFGSIQLDALQEITGTLGFTYSSIRGEEGKTGVFTNSVNAGGNNTSSPAFGTTQQAGLLDFKASNSSGARTSTETRGRNIALMFCIKY